MRVVPRAMLAETGVGGVSLTSRGGEIRNRLYWLSSQLAAYEHHITVGVANTLTFDLGEDYTYGPLVAMLYLPKSRMFGLAEAKLGGEAIFFHPALAPLSRPTRRWAEGLATGYDAVQQAGSTLKTKMTAKPVSVQAVDGWPVRPTWTLAKAKFDRARAAVNRAEESLRILRSLSPTSFVERIGPRGRRVLGQDAQRPVETHQLMVRYLAKLVATLKVETYLVENWARQAAKGTTPNRAGLKRRLASIERRTTAFEFVDVLFAKLFDEYKGQAPRQAPSPGQDSKVAPARKPLNLSLRSG